MATSTKKIRKSEGKKTRYIGKPSGVIQDRIERAGPKHFGVISVDCAKRRSKWMMCNFFGQVIVEPTNVDHNAGAMACMISAARHAIQLNHITDVIVAIEMTGVYHRPIMNAWKKAGFETRLVHPFAANHFSKSLHPSNKTDNNDLEAIFQAAVNGYGLCVLPVDDIYLSLKYLARHRKRLVKQRSRLQVQIRCLLHQTMPGYADLFDDDTFFDHRTALPLAYHFESAKEITKAGTEKMALFLKNSKTILHWRSIEKIIAWARTSPEQASLSPMLSHQWKQLYDLWNLITKQVNQAEIEMAHFLVKTPYVLLMSVAGINVVSAAGLAGEAGPIEHYATCKALTGRAGLFPSRYQSDAVDRADGPVPRNCNRKLRGALVLIAKNLASCNSYYRGIASIMDKQKVAPLDRYCRIANRASRMIFQLVGGKHVWRKQGIKTELILKKLNEYHRDHQTSLELVIKDMQEAIQQFPKSIYESESKPILEMIHKKSRGPVSVADVLVPVLLRLGVTNASEIQSIPSEARDQ